MAPSRRKSKASSAAAAAAARRQWNVGDLVLAKVKGFPAWPATVSEPEKWGYSADWKKVLVYFFGTKQIAFCNPADVEAFTEEKKESLLGKRHGKGADFVRAVQEIIESFEKSKKQDQLDDVNAVDEVIRPNAGNSVDSLPSSRLRDQNEASSGTFISQLNSYCTRDRDEVSPPAEDAVTNTSHDRDTLSEEPTHNVVVAETSAATTLQTHSNVKKRRASRSRSSSRSQNLMVPSNYGNNSVRDITSNVLRDGSLRRNKQIRTPPDASEIHGAGSPGFVSNGSIEDDGSEIVTVYSDTLSFTEGSTLEFGSNLQHIETVECLEGEVEPGKRPDFPIEAVVTRKRRKLTRKRGSGDAPEHTDVLDKLADEEAEMHKSEQDLPNICEKLDGRFPKEDGDEHLPLVKRARVRMGKQSALGEKVDSFIKMEENSSKEVPISGLVYTSSNCAGDNSANTNSLMVKGDVVNSSPSNTCFQFPDNRPHSFENRKNQAFGSLDGEAALPPSKRLHRALEAMSANVAEDGLVCTETPVTNGCCLSPSPIRKYQHKSKEREAENNFGVQYVDSHGHNATENHTSPFSADVNPLISEENKRSSVDADNWTQPVASSKSSKEELGTAEGVIQTVSTDHFSPDLDGRSASPRIDQDSVDQLSPKNEEKLENMGSSHDTAEIPVKEADTSESTGISRNPVSEADIITKVSPQNGTTVHSYSKEGTFCDNTKSLKIPPDDNSQVDGMCEIVRDVNNKSFQNTEKVSIAIWGTKHLSHSASISDDSLGAKDVAGIQSRPSPADGALFPARDSPSYTSLCRKTQPGSNNFLQNNGCCSPEVQLHENDKKTVYSLDVDEEKSDSAVTSVGKSNHADAGACLTSFETMLGALTRTKESIGRATRIAIDCVKYGTATKVVDILARNLEKEPSLHKRVDLFFLVDSITQCSRGLKGDVRGIFPSAIQSVLSRLLSAAAPPGNTARENRRQCLKVLRLWLERRILPETIVRHHMRHLDSLSSSTGAYSRRPLRNERAFDDPLREMEGMLVDEYGSNSSFQLPGFCMPRMVKVDDDGSDSDGGSFEAVTPEHNSETPDEREPTPTVRKHRHILEDVDGELEMEDVAPSSEAVMSNGNEVNTAHTSNHEHIPSSLAPPLPDDVPPSSPPLPTSPPPPPPPPPPPLPPPPSVVPETYTNGVDLKLSVGTNNMQDNLQAVTQQELALRTKPMSSDALNYHAPERQNFQMETRLPDSSATCSFGNVPVSHVPMGPMNNVPQTDGEVLHNKAYHLPPPPPTSSSQFSYTHADRQVQSWRDASFPHYNRYHYPPNMEGGNFYTDHDRSIPHDFNERWRFSGPSFSGPFHSHDRAGVPPGHVPYIQGEPTRVRNQGWDYPSQEMNYRNSMPLRPSCEAPRYWRPR